MGVDLTFSHSRIISLPPATLLDAQLSLQMTRSDMAFLSKIGSETTGASGTVNRPRVSLSRNTWKHRRTAFRSMLDGCERCANPAAMKGRVCYIQPTF